MNLKKLYQTKSEFKETFKIRNSSMEIYHLHGKFSKISQVFSWPCQSILFI